MSFIFINTNFLYRIVIVKLIHTFIYARPEKYSKSAILQVCIHSVVSCIIYQQGINRVCILQGTVANVFRQIHNNYYATYVSLITHYNTTVCCTSRFISHASLPQIKCRTIHHHPLNPVSRHEY